MVLCEMPCGIMTARSWQNTRPDHGEGGTKTGTGGTSPRPEGRRERPEQGAEDQGKDSAGEGRGAAGQLKNMGSRPQKLRCRLREQVALRKGS